MNWIIVSSSNVSSIGYNQTTNILGVTFHSGSTYYYHSVPQSVYHDFLNSYSKGSFVHTNLKDKYFTTKEWDLVYL